MKTDSRLSAYCHGNADFLNVWEQCWPTHLHRHNDVLPEGVYCCLICYYDYVSVSIEKHGYTKFHLD